MTEWDKAKKYLVFYAKDDKCIKRRDIRHQLKDAVEAGDNLQEKVTRYEGFFNIERIDQIKQDEKKLEAIRVLLTGTCESYDEGHCEPSCDGDADYEHCLTRKILEVLSGSIDNGGVRTQ